MTAPTNLIHPRGVGNDQGGLDAVTETDQAIRHAGFAVETFDLSAQVM